MRSRRLFRVNRPTVHRYSALHDRDDGRQVAAAAHRGLNAISPVLEVEEEITARMPASPETARLEIPEGTPVFEVIRTYHTADGPLDVARFVIRADMAAFSYRFPVPD